MTEIFSKKKIIPAAGQGVIAAQCRKRFKSKQNIKRNQSLQNRNLFKSRKSILKSIGGDCHTALGALAVIKKNNIIIEAELFSDDGKKSFRVKKRGKLNTSISLGHKVGIKLLKLMGKNLKKDMNIILTRPLIEIEDLMGKLFTMGHKIIHIPTLKISSKHNKNIDIRNFDSIIFTSANAIRNFKTDNEKKNIICYLCWIYY